MQSSQGRALSGGFVGPKVKVSAIHGGGGVTNVQCVQGRALSGGFVGPNVNVSAMHGGRGRSTND